VSQRVYSTRFVSVAPAAANATYYTVPAGYVAVVRTMTFGWAEPARSNGILNVLLAQAGQRIWSFAVTTATVGSQLWVGHLVLPAGEQLRAQYTGTPGQWLTISGYLLVLP
jgi:hypothetical protein